jgi:signal transduction histidine kinase
MLHDKLVLVDLPEGTASEPYREISPYGEMSVAEVEANLIASLMTRSFLIAVPGWFSFVISGLGLGLISLHLTRQVNKRHRRSLYLRHLWFMLGLVGSYLGFGLLLFWQGVILPLAVPISGWLGTGFGIVSYLIFRQSQQQKQKLAERQAVLFQTRKLLYRVATDIHDGPLQDLKLVMDSIELLSLEHPSLSIDPLLDRLETVGLGLRNQLSNTRTIAEKLGITPEIQSGLAPGIHQWLQQLIHSGDLVLNVKEHLQPLREPKSDSAWIDAREDIFRFFREAMTNVIRHAQPPNGTATQVLIDLSQEGTQCCLLIENDGAPSTDRIDRKHSQGGYGTKLMATIAAELPNGSWQRIALEAGGMRVTLRWTMDM